MANLNPVAGTIGFTAIVLSPILSVTFLAYCDEIDVHYVFEKDGQTYILRKCDEQKISVVPINQTVVQDNELVTIQEEVLKVLNNNGDEYYYSFDTMQKYFDDEIDEAYEEQLINNGARVLKK